MEEVQGFLHLDCDQEPMLHLQDTTKLLKENFLLKAGNPRPLYHAESLYLTIKIQKASQGRRPSP